MSATQIGFIVVLFVTGLLTVTFAGETGAEKVRHVIAALVLAVLLGAGLGLLPQN